MNPNNDPLITPPTDIDPIGDHRTDEDGPGSARRMKTPRLSAEAMAERAPRPPEELVDALHDRIHPASGRLLASKPVRVQRDG